MSRLKTSNEYMASPSSVSLHVEFSIIQSWGRRYNFYMQLFYIRSEDIEDTKILIFCIPNCSFFIRYSDRPGPGKPEDQRGHEGFIKVNFRDMPCTMQKNITIHRPYMINLQLALFTGFFEFSLMLVRGRIIQLMFVLH